MLWMTETLQTSSLVFGMPLQPFRKDGPEMEKAVVVEDTISPVRPVLSLKHEREGKRPDLYEGSPLTCRTMLTRSTQRSYATSSLTTRPSEEGHQTALPRGSMRTSLARLRDPESLQEE